MWLVHVHGLEYDFRLRTIKYFTCAIALPSSLHFSSIVQHYELRLHVMYSLPNDLQLWKLITNLWTVCVHPYKVPH